MKSYCTACGFLCTFSDSVHNSCSASRCGDVWVWGYRADSESNVLCLYHYEPWLCWTIWTARQLEGLRSVHCRMFVKTSTTGVLSGVRAVS